MCSRGWEVIEEPQAIIVLHPWAAWEGFSRGVVDGWVSRVSKSHPKQATCQARILVMNGKGLDTRGQTEETLGVC